MCLAIISQHAGTQLALVPLFHGRNILVKLLSVLIAHCHEFSGKMSKLESKKYTFKDILHPVAFELYKISHHTTIAFSLMISRKTGSNIFNHFHAVSSTSLSGSSNFTPCVNNITRGPTNTPSLVLASSILGNEFLKCKSCPKSSGPF
jgi:hypothetical protein